MTPLTDLAGLAGVALAASVLLTTPIRRRPAPALTICFAAMWLPLDGLSLAAYVRGMIGDLSVSSLLLLGAVAARRCGLVGSLSESGFAWPALALLACIFYPLALGAVPFDPYRWGYGEPLFLGGLLVVAAVARWWRIPWVPVAIPLAVLAWAGGLYESTNLWDYLIDPLLAIYALGRSLTLPWRKPA